MTVRKPMSATDRAAQSQARAYARSNYGRSALDSALGFDSTPGIGARAYGRGNHDRSLGHASMVARLEAIGARAYGDREPWSMEEALSDEGAAKVNAFLEPLGRKEHEPKIIREHELDPEVAAPLADIAALLERARVKLTTLPKTVIVTHDGVHVHTSHLEEQEGRECVEKITQHETAHLCENGHYTLENGWCHRCREADRNPPVRLDDEALTFLRSPPTMRLDLRASPTSTDAETRAFDVRERAREGDDYVTVGDHPPERRVRW